jgi:hypothetical protein
MTNEINRRLFLKMSGGAAATGLATLAPGSADAQTSAALPSVKRVA